jgi:hypothetical protein
VAAICPAVETIIPRGTGFALLRGRHAKPRAPRSSQLRVAILEYKGLPANPTVRSRHALRTHGDRGGVKRRIVRTPIIDGARRDKADSKTVAWRLQLGLNHTRREATHSHADRKITAQHLS